MSSSNIEQSLLRYNIAQWGEGYFDVNDAGEITVVLNSGERAHAFSLSAIQEQACKQNLSLPLVLRFKDILQARVTMLKQAFQRTLKDEGCVDTQYLPVYPIKVNQQRSVVEEIVKASLLDQQNAVGLECGSKSELMVVMGVLLEQQMAQPSLQASIVCNGYKDRAYLRLALLAQQLGLRVYIVIEKLNELDNVLILADELGLSPELGLRVRLASIGKGKWQNSGGEKSKFGLTASNLLSALERLKDGGYTQSLKLLHFHIGSQIANIHDVHQGLKEASYYYCEIRKLGFDVQWLDVGGGLGVDYEGSRSRRFCSMNYDVQEYAHNIVHTVKSICQQQNVVFPNIMTEAGRAMSAHHAVLVAESFGVEQIDERLPTPPRKGGSELVQGMWTIWQQLETSSPSMLPELYHDICSSFDELCSLYVHGLLNLQERAKGEKIYQVSLISLLNKLDPSSRIRKEIIDEIKQKIADKLFINFSIFRSLPDVWGIDQVFPIVPLKHLNKPMTRQVVVQDVTCDSDGRIDQYVDGEDLESSLPVAKENLLEGSLYGFFLVGAYQEILGDNHNLFGETDTIDVAVNAEGELIFSQARLGDNVTSVLDSVNFSGEKLMAIYKQYIGALLLDEKDESEWLRVLREGVLGSTYLSPKKLKKHSVNFV